MSSWRLAKSLSVLRDEINTVWPDRSRVSDGTKGDDAHAKRPSDHNPNNAGVVTAMDITNDPDGGPVATELAEFFRELGRGGDRRVKYVISARRIASVRENWAWRPYDGLNAHLHHVHVSVSTDPKYYDSTAPWGVEELEDDVALSPEDKDWLLGKMQDVARREVADVVRAAIAEGVAGVEIPLGPFASRALTDRDGAPRATATVGQLLQWAAGHAQEAHEYLTAPKAVTPTAPATPTAP